ncbi:MAG TPA: ABC transporter ATP-binding protein [Nitrososphaerales archaeon]|nr:ABC transporter ATP-binding protein [Nitrososphaerales archaeon]
MSQVQLDEEKNRGVPLIRISDLSVTFRKSWNILRNREVNYEIKAVDRVSFDIFESEIVSLVGESGSGKTTVARCLLGLVPVTGGSIKFKDVEVTNLKGGSLHNYWTSVQMIYQDPFESLDPGQTVHSIISAPIRNLTGERNPEVVQSRVVELLQEMDMEPEEVMWKYPHQLSGGQRQRVNIARALAANPSLLIADEPITMLDAAQRLNILALLKKLQRNRKLSILLITHDLASAKVMSQRTLVMYLGKLVENGRTKNIMTKPHHPYVELILDSTPRLARSNDRKKEFKLTWIEQSEKVRQGCVFQPRCKYATEICKTVEPELVERSNGDFAACHNPLNV